MSNCKGVLQIQTSITILTVPILVATFFVQTRFLYFIILSSISLVNLPFLFLRKNVGEILVGYIFFNLTCIVSIWISRLKDKTEAIIITSAEKDAKLKEIGFVSSSIIHEIGNPISVIMNTLEVLHRKVDHENFAPDLKKEFHQFVGLGQKNTLKIKDIIDSITSMVRSNSNTIHLPLITTEELIQSIRLVAKEHEELFNIEINIIEPKQVFYLEAKKIEVLQIITNLIRNACISISQYHGKIWVEFNKLNNIVNIQVCDSGPGLPDIIESKMGQALNSGTTEGLGLGLSISMALAAKNNSALQYCRKEETTSFSLNLNSPAIPDEIPPEKVIRSLSNKYAHLLTIENNTLFIYMRDVELKLDQFKILMKDELEVIESVPFRYIVMTNNSELTKETKEHFRSEELNKNFISGAIIGQSKAVIAAANFFNKIIELKYPIKLFNNYRDALGWTKNQ